MTSINSTKSSFCQGSKQPGTTLLRSTGATSPRQRVRNLPLRLSRSFARTTVLQIRCLFSKSVASVCFFLFGSRFSAMRDTTRKWFAWSATPPAWRGPSQKAMVFPSPMEGCFMRPNGYRSFLASKIYRPLSFNSTRCLPARPEFSRVSQRGWPFPCRRTSMPESSSFPHPSWIRP